MSDRFFLKPAPGMQVRKPQGGYLPAEGDWITPESYWLRRLADGDVIDATTEAKRADKADAKAK